MYARRVRSRARNGYGISSIRRHTYSTVNGMNTKAGWWDLHRQVEQRSGGLCEARIAGVRCGKRGKDVHHIVKLSDGGTNTMANLIHLCEDCHNRRHNHMFWRRKK